MPYSVARQCFAWLTTSRRSRSIPVGCVSFVAHKRHLASLDDGEVAAASVNAPCRRASRLCVEVQRELRTGRLSLFAGLCTHGDAVDDLRKGSGRSLGESAWRGDPAGGLRVELIEREK